VALVDYEEVVVRLDEIQVKVEIVGLLCDLNWSSRWGQVLFLL
jgi:tetrahydromethanopterin S-methyltransferase subunit G